MSIDAVRAKPDGIHNRADCAGLHQIPGFHDATHSEVLGIVDRIDTLCFRLHAAHFGELSQRGHARLVRQEILASAHNLDAQECPVSVDASARHQGDIRVVEDASDAIEADRLRIAPREIAGEIVLRREKADQRRARGKERIHLAEDMIVVDADDGEADRHVNRAFILCELCAHTTCWTCEWACRQLLEPPTQTVPGKGSAELSEEILQLQQPRHGGAGFSD